MRLLRKKFYKFVRGIFPSLQYADHHKARRRLSLIYLFATWQLFGATIYYIYQRNIPQDNSELTPGGQRTLVTLLNIRERLASLGARAVLSEAEVLPKYKSLKLTASI